MEARTIRAALLAAALVVSMGASYRTPNFIIQTGNPQLAEQFGKAAEKHRRELAVAWLGHPMPDWSQPCVITVRVGPTLGAGGATTFVFSRGEVYGWRMTIQGPAERILDSVLPHEITHMIFACRFRRPLPRWADEGGATSVEHPSERARHKKMLIRFLQSNRGIAFNRMFAMTEYPRDIMPLYAQGYSLAEFLIQQGGRRKFLEFLDDAMEGNQWTAAARRHYDFGDVGKLQNSWLAWVTRGSPPLEPRGGQPDAAPQPEMLAAGGKPARPEPNLIYRIEKEGRAARPPGAFVPVAPSGRGTREPSDAARAEAGLVAVNVLPPVVLPASGWHRAGEGTSRPPDATAGSPSPVEPVRTQTAHPQPIEPSRQVILEWGRR